MPIDDFNKACIFSEEEAVEAAKQVGYPVMLKASEGGGGKGIRMAKDEAALREAYPQVLGEVPGSPVFLVQLCTGARHLEVQVMADNYGNAIALGGRDCSTQRRFQKIFEEGPPIIAPDEVFGDMMKKACDLCNTLGYKSAGTVEYLFVPQTNTYYFLELNPRLQVEHPVTEGITGVSLPATQIQVAMGIPLYNVPEVRSFYDKSPTEIGEFDLNYFKPSSQYAKHVVAARITAENPDEGFKPTSGKIERINFQSNTKVWGYFSVMADGGVHEYADSQFGHLFATGDTREQARRSLVMALKELFIMGEIRTTVEYLGELLETKAFRENTIDTAWLDGLIAARSVSVEVEPTEAVINAAVYRAHKVVQDGIADFKSNLEKGQLSTLPLRELQSIPVEITYRDTKYSFVATQSGPDSFSLATGDQTIEVKTREQADGSLYVAYGSESHQLYAKEEPLGLRMVLDGVTVLLPTVYDPSELRSDITGKLVRYLVEDGAQVEAGAPYAEAEAMKMLITIKAGEAGKVKYELQPGAIINQGDLLASLSLKDPSKVKKIETFTGELTYAAVKSTGSTTLQAYRSASAALKTVLDGYPVEPEPHVQQMLAALSSIDLVIEEVGDAAAALGNKLPAELDEQLRAAYADARSQHVDGDDTAEAARLTAKLAALMDDFVAGQYEVNRAPMVTTLSPIRAVVDKYSAGLREHALSVVTSLFDQFMAVESHFVDAASTDQAIAALIKANADDLSVVYRTALAHRQLGRRAGLAISLLRQLSSFPERFGVEPLRTTPQVTRGTPRALIPTPSRPTPLTPPLSPHPSHPAGDPRHVRALGPGLQGARPRRVPVWNHEVGEALCRGRGGAARRPPRQRRRDGRRLPLPRDQRAPGPLRRRGGGRHRDAGGHQALLPHLQHPGDVDRAGGQDHRDHLPLPGVRQVAGRRDVARALRHALARARPRLPDRRAPRPPRHVRGRGARACQRPPPRARRRHRRRRRR